MRYSLSPRIMRLIMTCLLAYFLVSIDAKRIIAADEFIDAQKSIEVALPVRGSKGVIEVKVLGEERCFRKSLVDLAWDVSALLGEGSLSFMYVYCRSGKPTAFGIDAEVPRALRPTTLQGLPDKLLSISRKVTTGFPQQGFSIIWFVKRDVKTENLGSYSYSPNEYEEFEFLDQALVKKGKRPDPGCQAGVEEKIFKVVTMRTGLKPFAWVFSNMVTCNKDGTLSIWGVGFGHST